MIEYEVDIDGVRSVMKAESLAALCNRIRGTGQRIRVWNLRSAIQLIDTKFGDNYNLIKESTG